VNVSTLRCCWLLAVVSVSLRFPAQQPSLVLQSIYHTRSDDTRFFKLYTSYPYSPRWSGAEMAQRMRYVDSDVQRGARWWDWEASSRRQHFHPSSVFSVWIYCAVWAQSGVSHQTNVRVVIFFNTVTGVSVQTSQCGARYVKNCICRSTLWQSQLNKACFKCPSVRVYVPTYVRPSTKFLRFQWNLACS